MVEQFIREGADPVIVAGVAFTPGHFDEQAVCPANNSLIVPSCINKQSNIGGHSPAVAINRIHVHG